MRFWPSSARTVRRWFIQLFLAAADLNPALASQLTRRATPTYAERRLARRIFQLAMRFKLRPAEALASLAKAQFPALMPSSPSSTPVETRCCIRHFSAATVSTLARALRLTLTTRSSLPARQAPPTSRREMPPNPVSAEPAISRTFVSTLMSPNCRRTVRRWSFQPIWAARPKPTRLMSAMA